MDVFQEEKMIFIKTQIKPVIEARATAMINEVKEVLNLKNIHFSFLWEKNGDASYYNKESQSIILNLANDSSDYGIMVNYLHEYKHYLQHKSGRIRMSLNKGGTKKYFMEKNEIEARRYAFNMAEKFLRKM